MARRIPGPVRPETLGAERQMFINQNITLAIHVPGLVGVASTSRNA